MARWDDSNIRSCRADLCNVVSRPAAIVLVFGTRQSGSSDREIAVHETDRVALPPAAAKQLCVVLARIIADYDANEASKAADAAR